MYLKFTLATTLLISSICFAQKPSQIVWSEKPLNYNNFKKPIPKAKLKTLSFSLSSNLSWKTMSEDDKIIKFTVLNMIDENKSFISKKDKELLKEAQYEFDYSELYARKIRKEAKLLIDKKDPKKEDLIKIFNKYTNQFHKFRNENLYVLKDQPHLFKLKRKRLTDSLSLYNAYKN